MVVSTPLFVHLFYINKKVISPPPQPRQICGFAYDDVVRFDYSNVYYDTMKGNDARQIGSDSTHKSGPTARKDKELQGTFKLTPFLFSTTTLTQTPTLTLELLCNSFL